MTDYLSKTVSSALWIDIPFHDVDSAEIAWHGHYVKYFELARCELLEKVNYSYLNMVETGYFWPVVDLQIKYINAAKFAERVQVIASLEEWEYRLRIRYEIKNEAGETITKGKTDQVPLDANTRELILGTPQKIIDRIENAIKQL